MPSRLDHVEGCGVDAGRPLLAAQVDRVLLDVVLQLKVGLAGLATEDVRRFAGVELGPEDVEVLVSGDDLVVDVDAGLFLELPRQLHLRRRLLLFGVPTQECYAWGAAVHAPFEGEVIRAVDGNRERGRVHPLLESILAMKNALTFTPARLPAVLGNHVILRRADLFAAFAHLAPGSVSVREGQAIRRGELIGRVGHSGNSTSPHLHFQLMDSADPLTAQGVACAFESYEVLRGDAQSRVQAGVPGKEERIRFTDPAP